MNKQLNEDLFFQLKAQTKSLHDAVEAVAFANAIKNKTLQQQDYQILIQRNYSIHQALEHQFENALKQLEDSWLIGFYETKSHLLKKDLQSLKASIPDNSKQTSLPCFTNIAQLIGGLYVVEGSMLGGQIIGKLLKNNPYLQQISTFHFFQSNAEKTRQRWLTFIKKSQEESFSLNEIVVAVQSAKETFQFYERVYRTSL